jgi:surface-adhesin protein E
MIIAAIALVLPTRARATQWVLLAKTQTAAHYVDADAVVFDEATATIWLKTEYASKGKSGEMLTIEKWMHDCANHRAKLLALTLYKADGSVIGSAELPRYRMEWSTVVPGSAGETVHTGVCSILSRPIEERGADKVDLTTI